MTPSNLTSPRYFPELDGLRAIAALGVVALHWSPTYTFWMWSFVDLFFVLSGFLISRILIRNLEQGSLQLPSFWIARAFRIWPVYFLTLGAVLLGHFLGVTGTALTDSQRTDALLSLLYLQFTPLYAQPGADPMIMFEFLPGFLHSWSLAVEEQFYLLWPFLLALWWRQTHRHGVWFCLLGVVFAMGMRGVGFAPALLLARMDGLLLGALLALWVCSPTAPSRANLRIGLGGSLVVGLALTAPYILQGYLHGVSTEAALEQYWLVSGFALIYFSLVGWVVTETTPSFLQPLFLLLTLGALRYLGRISYAVYMFHFPILIYIKPRIAAALGESGHGVSHLIVLSLIIGLPALSRVLLEQPLLTFKDRVLTRRSA